VSSLTARLAATRSDVARLRADQSIHSRLDPAETRRIEQLTHKWTAAAQEVLQALLDKVQQHRPVTMSALLHDLQIEPRQVLWNEEAQDFDEPPPP